MSAGQDPGPMAQAQVPEALYIDERVLEFYKAHMQRDVQRAFRYGVLLPIGLCSLLALALVVFHWIPTRVPDLLAASPAVQAKIAKQTEEWLRSSDRLPDIVRERLRAVISQEPSIQRVLDEAVSKAIQELDLEKLAAAELPVQLSGALGRFVAGEEGRKAMDPPAARAIEVYFTGEVGREAVSAAVRSQLDEKLVRGIVHDEVNRALRR
ncbi:MAG: hypothetical protein IT458_05675 [Planctomycetes bacterium]|nr:hypothetical protein [Planctomycetota bacterium]